MKITQQDFVSGTLKKDKYEMIQKNKKQVQFENCENIIIPDISTLIDIKLINCKGVKLPNGYYKIDFSKCNNIEIPENINDIHV